MRTFLAFVEDGRARMVTTHFLSVCIFLATPLMNTLLGHVDDFRAVLEELCGLDPKNNDSIRVSCKPWKFRVNGVVCLTLTSLAKRKLWGGRF